MPVFARDGSVSHDYFWWLHEGTRAIRIGDWKLVADKDAPWELYDLSTDRAESVDLAGEQPEKVQELEKAWTNNLHEFRKAATTSN